MGPNLLQALYDSLNAGKAGVKAAFAPKLGGPDAESAFKSALAGGVGAAMVPVGALDEAATGAGEYMAEDVGRAGAAVERAGMPTLGKALGVGGAALGMIPVAGSFAVDPEAGAAKVAGRSVLEHLAAQNLPEAVMRKAESLQAMYGEDALGKIVKEYADKGVPLFSHDLPMDEASRMARATQLGYGGKQYHGSRTAGLMTEFDPQRMQEGLMGKGVYQTENPGVAGGKFGRDFSQIEGYQPWGYLGNEGEQAYKVGKENFKREEALKASRKELNEMIKTKKGRKGQSLSDADIEELKRWRNDLPDAPQKLDYENSNIGVLAIRNRVGQQLANADKLSWRKKDVSPAMIEEMKYILTDQGKYPEIKWPLSYDQMETILGKEGMTKFLQDEGYKGIEHTGGFNTGGVKHKVNVVFDPANVRSQFAAFDPRMKDSRFLLALKAGAIPLAGLGAAASLEGQ